MSSNQREPIAVVSVSSNASTESVSVSAGDLLALVSVGGIAYGLYRFRRWNDQRKKTAEEVAKAKELIREHRRQQMKDLATYASIFVGAAAVTYTYFKLKKLIEDVQPDAYDIATRVDM